MVIAMMISSPTLLVYLLLTQLDFYTNGVKYYSMFDFFKNMVVYLVFVTEKMKNMTVCSLFL